MKKSVGLLLLVAFASAGTAGPREASAAEVTVGPGGEILVDGAPFFPIMTWLQSSSRIEEEKPLGINTWVGNGGGGSSAEYLGVCEANGVWCVMDPGDMSVSAHPSLLGWIFGDEPDLESNAVEPSEILDQYNAIKAADPHHLTFLTLTAGFFSEMSIPDWMGGSRDRYYDYCQATDVVGFDIYPIYGWCQTGWIHYVADSQEELAGTYAPSKPTYQWIEAVRTSSQWCELDERGEDDGPYAYEIRNEVWQSIVHGAKAVGYFTHSWECPDYTQICLSAEQETELTRTNAQITALTDAILGPDGSSGVTMNAPDGGRIDWMARRRGAELVLFAVSLERSAQGVSFGVAGMTPGSSVEVFEEGRSIAASGTSFEDGFEELGVHIYIVALESAGEDDGPPDATPEGGDTTVPDTADDAGQEPGTDTGPDAAQDTGPQDAPAEGEDGGGDEGCGCAVAR